MNIRFLVFLLIVSCMQLIAQPLQIENASYAVTVDETVGSFSIKSKLTGKTFLIDGKLGGPGGTATVVEVKDSHFGSGQCIQLDHANRNREVVALYPQLPFVAFSSVIHNDTDQTVILNHVPGVSAIVDLDKVATNLMTLGTGGLLSPANNPGSYLFLTVVDPATRHGVVGGWLSQDRSSGVIFSPLENTKVTLKSRLDYGCLRIKPHSEAKTETFLLGYFDDARSGLEEYADAIAKYYSVKLHPRQSGYCTWYMEKYSEACDEAHLAELSAYAAKNLGPYGLDFIQIDDGWQEGIKKNGPKRDFTTHNSEGPYPHGMKPTVEMISKLNLTPGIWFMPFAASSYDAFFKEHADWFVQTQEGKPYETDWGGTCLDLSRPETRDYVRSVVTRIGHDWGYRLFKMDGFWTGSATKQIYVNNGFKEDGIGDAVFFNPDKTNIEVMRDGVKLVRDAAGPDVFLLGCCLSQNMRSLSGSLGLLDAMRVGPDTGAGTIGYPHATRLWFLNGRVWWNDPDCVSVRASVSLDQARLNASFAAIAGDLFYNSDWMPDFPTDRLDILRRCMPGHNLSAQPVDVFTSENARIWHLPDTRGPVRRDIVAFFNYKNEAATISDSTADLGLPDAPEYIGFDFWADKFLPPFKDTLTADLPANSCRVFAIRPVADHPQIISSSRHITQGMVDVSDETWNASERTLSATSQVVGGDPDEMRIVVPTGDKSWSLTTLTVSGNDIAAGVETKFVQDGPFIRATLTSGTSRSVSWTATFEPTAIHTAASQLDTGIPLVSDERVKQLQDLHFGMFICWSFSTFSGKEWTTEKLGPEFFKATGCDTDQWAKTAKEAGMGYILFLAKHHDGFCLWDTKTTDLKVTKSPLGMDVLAKLKASCEKYGIKLALYFSEGDWNFPGAVRDGAGDHGGSNPEMKKAQLKELLTQYGPIEYIWFDHAQGDGGLSHVETVKWVKSFQPDCFVGFNHGQAAGDIRLGEEGRPGPMNKRTGIGNDSGDANYSGYRLAEFTYPILPKHKGGANWFYSLPEHDQLCLPAKDIYADYVGAVKFGNIYSLDVGPDYTGRLRAIDVETLHKVGEMIRAKTSTNLPSSMSDWKGKTRAEIASLLESGMEKTSVVPIVTQNQLQHTEAEEKSVAP